MSEEIYAVMKRILEEYELIFLTLKIGNEVCVVVLVKYDIQCREPELHHSRRLCAVKHHTGIIGFFFCVKFTYKQVVASQ